MLNKHIVTIKKLYNKFLKLPIYYKVLTSILISLLLHFSFSLLFYIGLYNYTYQYNIPYFLIEELNLNLLIIPLYFDTFKSIIMMFILMFFVMLIIKAKLIKIRFKKGKIKFTTLKSYILSRYRKCKKTICKFNSKEYILLHVYTYIGFFIFIFVALTYFILYIDGGLKFIIIFIVPILLGFIIKLENYNLHIFLLNIIIFLLISFSTALTSNGIKTYLRKTNLGGEIPISIKIKKDFYDGYLILMTKKTILLRDINKTIISEIPIKFIRKINYPIKERLKTMYFNSIPHSSRLDKYDTNSASSIKFSGEISDLDTPFSNKYKFDFNSLHN